MSITLKGGEKLENTLSEIEEAIHEISGGVELSEILTDEFIRQNTDFDSYEEFLEESPIEGGEIPESKMDSFVQKRTGYETWDEMMEDGIGRYLRKELDI